jgi:hypothetical protein
MSERNCGAGKGKRILVLDEEHWEPMRLSLIATLVHSRQDIRFWEESAQSKLSEERNQKYLAHSRAGEEWARYLLMRYFGMTEESIAPPKEPKA